jgi:glucan phosphoethanolaminetransferase (alkaline phosphatase superfamily)
MILRSHLLSMALYALLASVVLALIRRNDLKSRIKYGISLFLIMVLGAIAFGWFMFLFVK